MRKIRFALVSTLGVAIAISLLSTKSFADQTAFCSAYARSSVLSHIDNIKSQCGFKGEKWSPGLRKHQSWCLNSTKSKAKQHLKRHQIDLQNCGRSMQRNLTWDELSFSVQNKLFAELILAVTMDDIESLKLFEKQGIDLTFEWRLIDGGLLYWAISNQAAKVIHYLLEEKSANPNSTSNGGPNPLVKLINRSGPVNYRLLDYLLRKGAKPNHGGEDYSDDSFPLTTAASNNDLQSVRILLKHNANPNLYESVPPLMMAISHNNFRMVDLLLKFGANPNLGVNGLKCLGTMKEQKSGEFFAMDSALTLGNKSIINALKQSNAKTTKYCLSAS